MIFPFKHLVLGRKNNTQKTNADRIRAMSDKELAEMLILKEKSFTCFECREIGGGKCYIKCEEQCLKWLKRPAEGE